MTDRGRDASDITHATLSILFLGLLIAATFWVLSPFLTSILWAVIVSVAVWPAFLRLERRVGNRRRLAVAIVTALLLLTIFIPVTLAVATIVRNAGGITTEIRSYQAIAMPPAPAWVENVPMAGRQIASEWNRVAALSPEERVAEVTPHVQRALQWFALKVGNVGAMLLQFLLTAIITAIVLSKGEMVRDDILRFARRLGGQHGVDVAVLASQTIRGVVLGVVGTALIQASIGSIGLLIADVPATGLLTALMLILCLAQLGPILVLLPVVVWLFWSSQTVVGSIVLVIAIVAGTLDSVVRPVLIRRGANLPLLLIFAGVIGGLIAFGIVGLFIGPVVLTVAHTLLGAWVAERPTEIEDAAAS
jgi:predicted PurR-regulated permease PerM